MTTVPHAVPTRMAHDIAALYGKEDDTLLAWQRACAQAAEALRPQPDEERLRKALTLAQDGHVTVEDEGWATVDSRGTRYTVQADGSCNCPDALQRGMTCKHALAVRLHQHALELLWVPEQPLAAPLPGAEPPKAWTPPPASSQPHAPTSASWNVHEAPASACFKFRVGALEMTYTLRGVDDAEVLPRIRETLPTLQELMEACEERAEQRRAAQRVAAPAAPTAAPAPAAAEPPAPPDMPALLEQALQAVLAQSQARTNGHAGPAASPPPRANAAPSVPEPDDQQSGFCSLHQAAMDLHSDPQTGDTWRSHYCEETERYCKGARPTRRNGRRR